MALPIPPLAESALLSTRSSFLEANRGWLEIKRKYDRLPFLRNPEDNAALITRDHQSAYIKMMKHQIDSAYSVLAKIALANQLKAGGSCAKWAQEQFSEILRDALAILPTWLMYVCEGKEVQPDGWCGPMWLEMWPLGNSKFECDKQWSKLTDKETKIAKERFCKLVDDSLNRHLMFIAGQRIVAEATSQTDRAAEEVTSNGASPKQKRTRNPQVRKLRRMERRELDSHRISEAGYKGADWAAQMDLNGHKTPEELQRRGCPPSFAAAQKLPRWKEPLSKWKSEVDRKSKRRR